jgi:elongation factor Ts
MSNIQLVSQLREKTASSLADCKSALVASNWNFEQAVDWIKAKGLLIADAKATKIASEGIITIKSVSIPGHRFSAMVEINTQTDFSAKSPEVQKFAEDTVAKLAECFERGTEFSANMVEEARKELVGKIRENVVVRRWFAEAAGTNDAQVFFYKHQNSKLGVLLTLRAESEEAIADRSFAVLGEELCLQIAGMNPLTISVSDLASEVVDRQKAIFMEQMKELNKPEASWTKIVDGKMNKWYSESALIEMESVLHPKKKIKDLLGKNTVVKFVRVVAGEGITAETKNLAEEVAEMVNG